MTATVLDRELVLSGSETVVGSRDLRRPPTLFGQESDWELVQSGYDLARRAIGYAMEDVPLRDAIAAIVDEAPSRDALRMAFDYLAYMRFQDVPHREQVSAFLLVEDAQSAYDRRREAARPGRIRKVWRRVQSWFSDAMRTWGELYERNGPDPFGGPLLPA